MLLHFLNRLKVHVKSSLLNLSIRLKWREDSRHLPLTAEHKELYEIIHKLCWRELHDFPDLVDCRDFNDRIQWLKLFDQDSEIIRCSDKVNVRDYVAERVGPQYLTKLYQVHRRFDDIDFDRLPSAFVIKASHDSGTVMLVKDKALLDQGQAKATIDSALLRRYGWEKGEWAYNYVEPRVLIEEYLSPETSNAPPDYKFYCVNGSIRFCHYIYDRGQDTKEQLLDPIGNTIDTDLYPAFKRGSAFVKPENWSEMIEIAERVADNFKCVRVDLFNVFGRIVVGELTFWPMAGSYKSEGQKRLGQLLDFDRKTFNKPILGKLNARSSMGAF